MITILESFLLGIAFVLDLWLIQYLFFMWVLGISD